MEKYEYKLSVGSCATLRRYISSYDCAQVTIESDEHTLYLMSVEEMPISVCEIDIESDVAKVLKYYSNCQLDIHFDDINNCFRLTRICFDLEIPQDCKHCTFPEANVYACSLGLLNEPEKLPCTLGDIILLDPVSGRSPKATKKLNFWAIKLENMLNDLKDVDAPAIQNVCMKTKVLRSDILQILKEWD